jgi:hypothetical protein
MVAAVGQKSIQIESVDHGLLNTKPELKAIYDVWYFLIK